jgi:hypothetical protein
MAAATKSRSTSSKRKSTSSSKGASKPPEQTAHQKLEKQWPKEGGLDGLQPYDLTALGVPKGGYDDGEQADLPVVPDHGRPVISSGSGGPEVRELGRLLGKLGYESTVTRGENPFDIADPSVMAAAQAFCRDYDVTEDPSAFGGDNPTGRDVAANHIGTWVWEAIIRAAERKSA